MAGLSDNLLIVTILTYLVAMLLHAVDYSFGKRSVVARAATRELVGAGGPAVSEPVATAESTAKRSELPGRLAVGVTALAVLAHFGTVLFRALDAGRMPWGNMYEFILTITFVGAVSWLVVVLLQPALRHLGLFVTLVVLLLTGVAGMVYKPVSPLVPALNSYWFVVHVSTVALSSGIFLVGGCASIMYLIRTGYDAGKRGGLYAFGGKLANAEAVERVSFRLHALAFPLWTFGVTAGAIWAEAAWGRYWGWDPKETWAFISWVVYAGYLHARATPSVKRRTTAWIAVIGWLTMMMNLFGVNLFLTGLHSYAGVS